MSIARTATLCLFGFVLLPASAQTLVAGACTPASQNLGSITSSETFASTFCAPTQPFVFMSNQVEPYSASFDFQLTQPTDFLINVQGTSIAPTQLQPWWSGVGVSASLFYEGQLVTTGFGRGIGGSEGPALLNPDFLPGFSNAQGFEPVGNYQIQVRGNGLGPIPEGNITVRLSATFDGGPVTPVPEPMTAAAQVLGLVLMGCAMAWRRRKA